MATESRGGKALGTLRKGYHGGVMQVDNIGFKDTQNVKSHPVLKRYHDRIKRAYGWDWNKIKWSDLSKDPVKSIIAARLLYATSPKAIPSTRKGRALYWKRHYNKSGKGKPSDYIKRTLPGLSSTTPTTLNKMAMELDLEVGDIILGGRYKNKREVVETIGTDELGQPTVNGKKLLSFRLEKKLPRDKWSSVSKEKWPK
jgi:hypothetical protein